MPGDSLDHRLRQPVTVHVLNPDELDLLELHLGGALERLPLDVVDGATLTDGENTPLAVVDDGTVRPTRALARGSGPHWDPMLRRRADDLRAELAGSAASGIVAVIIAEPPTRTDLASLPGLVGDASAVLVLVPVARRAGRPDAPDAATLVRAATTVSAHLAAATRVEARVVVVPWPGSDLDRYDLTWHGVAARYGAARVVDPVEHRDDQTRLRLDRLYELGRLWADELAALYPRSLVADLTRSAHDSHGRGAVVLLTGLSGSGKSTLARALAAALSEEGTTPTLLDGDEVRQHLSQGLGFDRASRELNIERIGYVASLVARHGGTAIAAPIAPFATGRARMRELATSEGAAFVLVHVSTPLAVCEARDRKGLYARARRGEVAEFTGISSPYEEPHDADLVVDTSRTDLADAVAQIRAAIDAAVSGR